VTVQQEQRRAFPAVTDAQDSVADVHALESEAVEHGAALPCTPMPNRSRVLTGATFVATGLLHFLKPRVYESIMPDYLPAHRELVLASGVAEMAGGAGLLADRTRRAAGWWLIATLVAVFPANVHMALHPERYRRIPAWALWLRLPLQLVFIWRVWKAGPAA
jgi:uncharacterized membrane protein